MKKLINICVLILPLLVVSCLKENGKKEYILHLEFSSGDVWEGSCHVLEKTAKQGNSDKYEGNKNEILINYDPMNFYLHLLKVEDKFLAGGDMLGINVTNFNMINNQSGKLYSSIEMKGLYTRNGRHYQVDNGTFVFKLGGTPFNVPDTIYTGSWSLKLK